MTKISELKIRRRTVLATPNFDEERKLRGELVMMLGQVLRGLDKPKFVTDAKSGETADRMRKELETCMADLERMFYRASSHILEYADKIKTAISTIDEYSHNIGGQTVVSENICIIIEYTKKWRELK